MLRRLTGQIAGMLALSSSVASAQAFWSSEAERLLRYELLEQTCKAAAPHFTDFEGALKAVGFRSDPGASGLSYGETEITGSQIAGADWCGLSMTFAIEEADAAIGEIQGRVQNCLGEVKDIRANVSATDFVSNGHQFAGVMVIVNRRCSPNS
ncbi:MAG: hypothetical protein AAGM38_02345 [Pseudomonadota bacterium]